MNRTALICATFSALGVKLISGLLERNWQVYLAAPDTPAYQNQIKNERLTGFTVDFQREETLTAVRESLCNQAQHIHMLVSAIDYRPSGAERCITEGLPYEEMQKTYDINTLGPLRVINNFYTLLSTDGLKRICAVSSSEGANNLAQQSDNYGYAMSFAALHMQMSMLFNRLRPEGYTFRLYAAGANEDVSGDYIVDYFTRDRSFEPGDPKHSDENRLLLRDGLGRELPW